jgi:predicted Fe-S protein YdhL (DUF1289 family)
MEFSPQRRKGRRENIFVWREMPPNKKVSVLSRQTSSLGAMASKRARSSSRRPAGRQTGMEFLIQSSFADWIKIKTLSATSAALR